jgi:hypothetical protein
LEHDHPIGARALNLTPFQDHPPSRRAIESSQDIQQGRLTATRVPHQRDKLAFLNLQINVLEGNVLPTIGEGENAIDVVNFNKDRHGRRGEVGLLKMEFARSGNKPGKKTEDKEVKLARRG